MVNMKKLTIVLFVLSLAACADKGSVQSPSSALLTAALDVRPTCGTDRYQACPPAAAQAIYETCVSTWLQNSCSNGCETYLFNAQNAFCIRSVQELPGVPDDWQPSPEVTQ